MTTTNFESFAGVSMTPPASAPSLLRPDDAAFIQQGISISVASRDVRHVPSIARALGCRLTDGGRQVRLLLVRSHSETLLRDVEKSGQIAAVFTQPTTHRTLQIKGSDARVQPASADDLELVRFSEAAFGREILPLGFSADFNRRLFAHAPDDLCAVTFTPADIFQQTPGPNAGARLETAS